MTYEHQFKYNWHVLHISVNAFEKGDLVDVERPPSTRLLFARTLREAVELAEEVPEHPAIGQVVDEVNPRAEERHHQIGYRQVDDVVVGGVVKSLVAPHDVDDEQVASDRQQYYDYIDDNLDDHFG